MNIRRHHLGEQINTNADTLFFSGTHNSDDDMVDHIRKAI